MPVRRAEAEWKGKLIEGSGRLKLSSGAFEGPYSVKSRIEEGQSATNPEELLGAAHAGCFTMAVTMQLSRKRITPRRIRTIANVEVDKVGDGFAITRIELQMEADVPGIDERAFQAIPLEAKQKLPHFESAGRNRDSSDHKAAHDRFCGKLHQFHKTWHPAAV
jgi:osmotically inducible protein OsmC